MATRIIVEFYTAPGLTPQIGVDTFNSEPSAPLHIITTPAGVLEIRAVNEVIKAYSPGRWCDAKVMD